MTEESTKFVKDRNKERLANKDTWLWYTGIVDSKQVAYKSFNTYIQVFKVAGIDYAGSCDVSVKDYKAILEGPFK